MLKTLEDYIVEMEKRSAIYPEPQTIMTESKHSTPLTNQNSDESPIVTTTATTTSEDVWTQLQQKENDLLLAAELGKALLEKNEELKRQYETTVEEFNRKLEAVEQDRHLLRRKLTNVESEFESRIVELQNDVHELSGKLHAKEGVLKQWEREKSALVAELNAQNARLTVRLKEAATTEVALRQTVEKMRDECAVAKSSLHEHMVSVEVLRAELEVVSAKGSELERRLNLATGERDGLASALEDASDRILLMERHAHEQDLRNAHSLHDATDDYFEMVNGEQIEDRLSSDDSIHHLHQQQHHHHRSLLAEMDISATTPNLSQECISVYRQLRALVQQLKTSQHTDNDDDSGLHSDCSNVSLPPMEQEMAPQTTETDVNTNSSAFTVGLLGEVASELVQLVLDTDAVRLFERLDQTRRDIGERDVELRRRADQLMALNAKCSVCEVELQAAIEERDRARADASNTALSRDEGVLRARDDRDMAVQRKTRAEVELAKTRVDLMQANSQLLEAIQQKVELSQQLEQWQMDMHELLDEQLRTKLTSQEKNGGVSAMLSSSSSANGGVPHPVAPPRRKLLSFFLR